MHAPRFEIGQLRQAVSRDYTDVAADPDKGFHFNVGRTLAERLGYPSAMLNEIPIGALESFAGVGNPFQLGLMKAGEIVVDIGSGAGLDALIASKMVGPLGKVIGVDMTKAMVNKAANNATEANAKNVTFLEGLAENLPLPDNSVDVAISNGVINLCPDKALSFREIYRVLKPGGRLQIADVLLETPVPASASDLIYLWTECVAGGLVESEYIEIVRRAGFRDSEVVARFDTFEGANVEEAAAMYGASGYNIRANKPVK